MKPKVILYTSNTGFTAEYAGSLPAVLTVCNGTDMVRSPTISGIRRSKNVGISRFDLDALGFAAEEAGLAGSPTRTVKIENVSFRSGKKELVTDPDEAADRLRSLLVRRKETEDE